MKVLVLEIAGRLVALGGGLFDSIWESLSGVGFALSVV